MTSPIPGPINPLTITPTRAHNSVRRTSTTDITFPEGIGGTVVADVRGRDLRTDENGRPIVLDELAIGFVIDPWTAVIDEVAVTTAPIDVATVAGLPVRGLVRRVVERFPDEAARRSLVYSTLEDFSGAHLVSGYAGLRSGAISMTPEHRELAISLQGDACVGWALDGGAITSIRENGEHAVPVGPPAPGLEGDDPFGSHAFAPLPLHSVRRRRRTDVIRSPSDPDVLRAEHHLRDTYADVDGEIVMHEYVVHATFDRDSRLASVDVDARVLPWQECPGAVPSAQRLVGESLDQLARRVREDLKGATTCTHLNSTLRTLADVLALDRYVHRKDSA
jgi:hypothetical protein